MTFSQRFVFASITMILLSLISFAQSPVNYSVKKFGAKGDGKSDDTKAIQEAIDKAALTKNSNVVFPSGIYLISNISIKANIKGTGNAIIKKIKMPLDLFIFCNIRDIKSIKVSNITFDGSVVLDSNRKVIGGSTPLHVYNCQNIIIANCTFKNSPFGGLRLEASKNISVTNCKSTGSRGIFGDGFYFTGTNTVQVRNCIAEDYERIGFVTEGNSFNISFTDCLAKDGRNASILSGGIEYNAGFWYENSANVKTIRCTALNNTHRGFVATTGEEIGDFISENIASFEFENCKSINNPTGFAVASFGKAVNTSLRNCSVSNSTTGFHATARDLQDRFKFINCKVSLKYPVNDNKNTVGFNWESPVAKNDFSYDSLPEFTFQNCFVEYLNPVYIERLLDKTSNNGDISTYAGGKAIINIINLTNSLKNRATVIKSRTGKPSYSIQKTRVDSTFLPK